MKSWQVALFASLLFGLQSVGTGQIFEWSGAGGTDNWSDPANWTGGTAPISGSSTTVNFSNARLSSQPLQDISTNFSLGTLNVSEPASMFSLHGSRITVAGGGSLNFSLPEIAINNSFSLEPGSIISMDGTDVRFIGDELVSTTGAPIPVTGSGSLEIGLFPTGPTRLGNLQIESGIDTRFYFAGLLTFPNGFSSSGPVHFEYGTLRLEDNATINANVTYRRFQISMSPDSAFTINGDMLSSDQDSGIILESGSTLTGTGNIYPWHYNFALLSNGAVLCKDIIAPTVAFDLEGHQSVIDGSVEITSGEIGGDFVITGDLTLTDAQGFGRTWIWADLALGGDLHIIGSLAQLGELEISGSATVFQVGDLNVLNNGHLISSKGIQVDSGGTLRGGGRITGNLYIDGNLEPSVLKVDGNINLSGQSTTVFVLEGTGADEFSVLRFAGSGTAQLAINGNVQIQFDQSFLPTATDEFVVCEGFEISGHFANAVPSGSIAEVPVGNGTMKLEYGTDFIRLYEYLPNPVSQPVTAFDVLFGNLISGGLTELAQSDNANLVLGRDRFEVLGRIEVEVVGQSATSAPTELALIVESAVFARTAVDQKIEFFNFTTQSYDLIDQRPASRLNQQVVEALVDVDAADYVGNGQALKARISFRSLYIRQQYGANLDHVYWEVR